jgi:hypothetical protein
MIENKFNIYIDQKSKINNKKFFFNKDKNLNKKYENISKILTNRLSHCRLLYLIN